jgi:hypothetical protein
MPDIFGRTSPTLNGVFAADLVKVTLSNGLTTTLMQSLGMNYNQQISKFYEIGGSNMYYVGGRTSGAMNIGRIVGPGATIQQIYTSFGNVCNAKTNTLQFSAQGATCDSGSQTLDYTCRYCVLQGIGLNVEANNVVISEQEQLMFGSLETGNNGVAAPVGGIGGILGPVGGGFGGLA